MRARGLAPVLLGWKPVHSCRFLSVDISVATFPFLVFTTTRVEQFPYTVSCGGRRPSQDTGHEKTPLRCWREAGQEARGPQHGRVNSGGLGFLQAEVAS